MNIYSITKISKFSNLVSILFLTLAVFFIYGKLILKTPANGDFYGAVSYALNFKKSFEDGQIIPRLILLPRTYQDGMTKDKVPPTADGTALMYYCFLPSALAYPFLKMGMNGQQAVGAALFFLFMFATFIFYYCGRVLGASRGVSTIAAFSYLLSPWLISNVFSRGGVAEGVSHCLLPLVFLGLAFVVKNRNSLAIFFIALGIFLLALAHNIFLLWSVTLCVAFASASLLSLIIFRESNFKEYLRIPVVIGTGVIIGMAMSFWQWLPALLTLGNTSMQTTALGSIYGASSMKFCDFSGILGWPRIFMFRGESTHLFYTLGWWTLPAIFLALFFCHAHVRRFAWSVALIFLFFFVFCYFPEYSFKYLPAQFNATQGTYRLLVFLSCIGAFAFCFVKWRLKNISVIVILAIIVLSQIGVFRAIPAGGHLPDDYTIKSFELNDFHPNSPFVFPFLREERNGGVLFILHTIRLHDWFNTVQQAENSFRNGSEINYLKQNLFLRIIGEAPVKQNLPLEMKLIDVDNKNNAISTIGKIDKKNFDIMLSVKNPAAFVRIQSNEHIHINDELYSFSPKQIYLIEDNPHSYIYADHLSKIYSHGYKRIFLINHHNASEFVPNQHGFYTVEIPMIYNKFIEISQNGKRLTSWCDFNHRINVKTNNLDFPLIAQFKLPLWIILTSILGFVSLMMVFLISRGWMMHDQASGNR